MADGLILRLNDDSTILSSTVTLEMTTGFDVVTPRELQGKNQRLAVINKGGTLIINGHGNATTAGGMSVSELAKLLYDSGLTGPVEIVLLACMTGTLGAPFALELKVTLVQSYKIVCSVSAPRGTVGANLRGEWKVTANGVRTDVTAPGAMFETTKPF